MTEFRGGLDALAAQQSVHHPPRPRLISAQPPRKRRRVQRSTLVYYCDFQRRMPFVPPRKR